MEEPKFKWKTYTKSIKMKNCAPKGTPEYWEFKKAHRDIARYIRESQERYRLALLTGFDGKKRYYHGDPI